MARLGVSLALALMQWLGWAGSTGDRSVHYVAADATLVPPRQRYAQPHTLFLARPLLLAARPLPLAP